MFSFSASPADAEPWKYRLDQFARDFRPQLAAIAWGFHLANPDSTDVLGIDLKPQPHFVTCPRRAVEALNHNVAHQLQEILGILDAHDPAKEVFILVIGEGQIKLLYFESDPLPPDAYTTLEEPPLELLMIQLEDELIARFPADGETEAQPAPPKPPKPEEFL